MRIDTLLFDVHLTLVGDQGFPREIIWRLIEEEGTKVNLTDYYHRYNELVHELFNWPKIQPFRKIRDIHRHRLEIFYNEYNITRDIDSDVNYLWQQMKTSQIYPEVADVIDNLKKEYKIGLISNADRDDPLIEILHENEYTFDAITTSEEVCTYKPNKKIFDVALQKLDCLPENALIIGDSCISDIQGAHNSNIKCVWINRKQKPLPGGIPKPDFEINNLTSLTSILAGLNQNKEQL